MRYPTVKLNMTDKSAAMAQNKKISQNYLRQFMSRLKSKLNDATKRVESPLAKYLEDGRLKCIVCNEFVEFWSTHINAKEHRANIMRRKISPQNSTTRSIQNPDPFKSPMPPSAAPKRPALRPLPQQPPKKLKSILKNAAPVPEGFFDSKSSVVIVTNENEQSTDVEMTPVPEKSDQPTAIPPENNDSAVTKLDSVPDTDLPQGFFDDPILDAKARNVEYRDPVEEEWERFQKEMKEEAELSARILQDDSEESTVDRQIEEVDEQMNNWSRVLNLEKKKEDLESLLSVAQGIKSEDMSDDNAEDDIDEFVSWRTKKSFK